VEEHAEVDLQHSAELKVGLRDIAVSVNHPRRGVPRRGFVILVCACAIEALMTLDASADAAPAPAGAPFDVLELRVLGNTALDARAIESAVYPFTGPAKRMTDVESARAALERTYHEHGFGTVFVDIPEQSVDDGVVRLRVTESRLRQVHVTGAKYFSGREIRAAVPAATENVVPNLPQLQKELTALNSQTRDRVVVPVLKAGPQPGTVDLALKVEDHLPFHGSVELNNQYTLDTTHLRAAVAASYDNMFGRLDSLSVQYQVAPESAQESHVIAASYALRLGTDGSSLAFQYINSKSDVATIGTLGVLGTGSVYGIRYLQPLPTTATAQNFTFEADYKDFKQSILVNPTSGLNTPVDYIALTAGYSGVQGTQHEQIDWSSALNFGFRGTPYNAQQFADKRFEAQPNYFYLRSDAGITVQLPAQFSTALRLSGQYSNDPLISNEQLPIGGAMSVRGYLEAEELGDSALRSSFQFSAPPLNLLSGRMHLNEFLFYDVARAFTVDPLPGQLRHVDLRSVGAGLRFDGINHVYGALTWAYPLVEGSRTVRGDSTLLFVVRGYW
jgi:hemolysin activation/secretion protein